MEAHGAPWRSVETSMEVGKGSMEVGGDLHSMSLHGGPWRSPWRLMEVSMEAHGAPIM